MITSCQHIKIMSLKLGTPYPIDRAEKVQTKYGEAILMTTRIPPDICEFVSTQTLRVSVQRRRSTFNEISVSLSLTYLGTNPASNSYILEIE